MLLVKSLFYMLKHRMWLLLLLIFWLQFLLLLQTSYAENINKKKLKELIVFILPDAVSFSHHINNDINLKKYNYYGGSTIDEQEIEDRQKNYNKKLYSIFFNLGNGRELVLSKVTQKVKYTGSKGGYTGIGDDRGTAYYNTGPSIYFTIAKNNFNYKLNVNKVELFQKISKYFTVYLGYIDLDFSRKVNITYIGANGGDYGYYNNSGDTVRSNAYFKSKLGLSSGIVVNLSLHKNIGLYAKTNLSLLLGDKQYERFYNTSSATFNSWQDADVVSSDELVRIQEIDAGIKFRLHPNNNKTNLIIKLGFNYQYMPSLIDEHVNYQKSINGAYTTKKVPIDLNSRTFYVETKVVF